MCFCKFFSRNPCLQIDSLLRFLDLNSVVRLIAKSNRNECACIRSSGIFPGNMLKKQITCYRGKTQRRIKAYKVNHSVTCANIYSQEYHVCGNKMPTRCNRGFYCRSYCLLNMFRATLGPSAEGYVSGLQDAAASCKPDT